MTWLQTLLHTYDTMLLVQINHINRVLHEKGMHRSARFDVKAYPAQKSLCKEQPTQSSTKGFGLQHLLGYCIARIRIHQLQASCPLMPKLKPHLSRKAGLLLYIEYSETDALPLSATGWHGTILVVR
jgi:hypothetical protein